MRNSMPQYIYFCHHVANSVPPMRNSMPQYIFFATYLNGGKSFSGASARCPLRLATSRKGLKLTLSELY
jgi:hypothetical protein